MVKRKTRYRKKEYRKQKTRKTRVKKRRYRRRSYHRHNIGRGPTLNDDGFYLPETKIKLHYSHPFYYIVVKAPLSKDGDYVMKHQNKDVPGTNIPYYAIHSENAYVVD